MIGWLAVLAISLAFSVASTLLMPKPKAAKSGSVDDLADPTAEAGRELPVPFGTVLIKSANVLWFGEKDIKNYKVKA